MYSCSQRRPTAGRSHRVRRHPATSFESNGRNVFIGRDCALYPRKDGTHLRWHADIVAVVTVEEGKVVWHDDDAACAGAKQTIERRRGARE